MPRFIRVVFHSIVNSTHTRCWLMRSGVGSGGGGGSGALVHTQSPQNKNFSYISLIFFIFVHDRRKKTHNINRRARRINSKSIKFSQAQHLRRTFQGLAMAHVNSCIKAKKSLLYGQLVCTVAAASLFFTSLTTLPFPFYLCTVAPDY